MKTFLTSAGVALMLFVSAAVTAADRPLLTAALSPTGVVVSNATPGGSVVVFGASQYVGEIVRLQRWQEVLTDSDRDGVVSVDTGGPMLWDTVWIAVDTENGATATAAAPESRFRRLEFPAPVLRKDVDGNLEKFATGRRMIDVLVVRPHVGAWAGFAVDGEENDDDQRYDGRTTIQFERMRKLSGEAPAPRHLTRRDVVVAVDLRRLQYYLTEVAE